MNAHSSKFFRRASALFLSLMISSYGVMAQPASILHREDLNADELASIFQRLMRGRALDPMTAEIYLSTEPIRSANSRVQAIQTFLATTPLAIKYREAMAQEFAGPNSELWKKWEEDNDIQVAHLDVLAGETLLLFKLIADGNESVAEHQFRHWLFALQKINFRRFSNSESDYNVLNGFTGTTLRLAYEELSSLTQEKRNKIGAFFDKKLVSNSDEFKNWKNFSFPLHNVNVAGSFAHFSIVNTLLTIPIIYLLVKNVIWAQVSFSDFQNDLFWQNDISLPEIDSNLISIAIFVGISVAYSFAYFKFYITGRPPLWISKITGARDILPQTLRSCSILFK